MDVSQDETLVAILKYMNQDSQNMSFSDVEARGYKVNKYVPPPPPPVDPSKVKPKSGIPIAGHRRPVKPVAATKVPTPMDFMVKGLTQLGAALKPPKKKKKFKRH